MNDHPNPKTPAATTQDSASTQLLTEFTNELGHHTQVVSRSLDELNETILKMSKMGWRCGGTEPKAIMLPFRMFLVLNFHYLGITSYRLGLVKGQRKAVISGPGIQAVSRIMPPKRFGTNQKRSKLVFSRGLGGGEEEQNASSKNHFFNFITFEGSEVIPSHLRPYCYPGSVNDDGTLNEVFLQRSAQVNRLGDQDQALFEKEYAYIIETDIERQEMERAEQHFASLSNA